MSDFKLGDKVKVVGHGEGTIRGINGTSKGPLIYVIEHDSLGEWSSKWSDTNLLPWGEDSLTKVVKTYTFGGVTFEDTGVVERPSKGQWYLSHNENQACICSEGRYGAGTRRILKPIQGKCQCK